MTVLLSYCPQGEKKSVSPKDGIELLSNHIHDSLTKIFPSDEVIYCHFKDIGKMRGMKGISHLFGISANFDVLAKSIKPDLSCLIAVNEHALMRRAVRDLRRQRKLTRDFDDPHDGFVSNLRETKYADFVLGIGNWSVFQSFARARYREDRVFITGYPYWQLTNRKISFKGCRTILIFLGYICTRKGADYVEALIVFVERNFPEFKVRLVGFVAYSKWNLKFTELQSRHPKHFEFIECRIQYGSNAWYNLANDVAFAIFPSHEEGLAGCAMDTMNLGVPLVHTSKTGIEFQHEILTQVNFEEDKWEEGIAQIIRGGEALWQSIAVAQREASFHLQPNYSGICKSLERIPMGRIWPNVDLSVLPGLDDDISFLSDSGIPYDYQVGSCVNPDIQFKYLGDELSLRNKLLAATMLIEKYTKYDSIQIDSKDNIDLGIVRIGRDISCSDKDKKSINLFVREYIPAANWPTGAITYLLVRESIITFFAKTRYKFLRFVARVKQKARIEVLKVKRRLKSANWRV